jgi:hypothetical protein
MVRAKNPDILVECPCCGAKLTIDPELRKVIAHEVPPKQNTGPDLDHAGSLLKEAAARREALFQQSTENEKTRTQLLERKFEEAFKKSKDEPVTKPTRDIDL